ncbi:MAG: NAD-dependent epimerase/dehydratase family protein [Candidatus Omnitrophica bacterium]|nr:NAD-dependent epimerase/dehydratase family protein [Candidatus Omnitrophota bacterium]
MKRNILITGGCGFVGSNLAVALRAEGNRVVCFDNLSRPGSRILARRVREHGCIFIRGDIRDRADLRRCTGGFDLLIDASAEPSVLAGSDGRDALYVVDNNLAGSVNCFEWCRRNKASVIFLSSSRVYPYDRINALLYEESRCRFSFTGKAAGVSGKGIGCGFPLDGYRSLYGATKLAAEFILREYSLNYGIPAIIDRCGVIAGPWQLGKIDQGVFTHWMVSHYFKRKLSYIGFGGTGKQVRDILHVDDLADLVKKQIRGIGRYRGDIFNVGGGAGASLSLREATALCRRITGNTIPIGREARNRPADIKWYITDNQAVENEFGWRPRRSAEETLADIGAWLAGHHKLAGRLFKVRK